MPMRFQAVEHPLDEWDGVQTRLWQRQKGRGERKNSLLCRWAGYLAKHSTTCTVLRASLDERQWNPAREMSSQRVDTKTSANRDQSRL